ncbi:MAG: DUF3325 domain-containing protein [Pseudomonadota bacterium]
MDMIIATLWLALAFVLSLAGCAMLAMTQKPHWRAITDSKSNPPKTAIPGWLCIAAALVPCIIRDGISFAMLLWPLIFALAAFSIAMTLTYKPSLMRPFSALLRS